MVRNIVLVFMMSLAIPGFCWADDEDEGPGRGVARISLLNGDVSMKRGDSGELVAAAINSPLVGQDRVLTGDGARAEIQFDWANMIRLASHTEIRLAELEYRRYTVQVARGTITFRVLRDQDADVEIGTPSVAVRPVKKGIYRVTVHEDGTSEITVRSGEAEIFTSRGSERLRSGKTMMARGTATDPEYRVTGEIQEDEWDKWNERRDRDLERSRSYNYLSRDIYGAEDLDDHGRWAYVAPYGYVWSPRVAVGWAPYRYGRWSWVDWYGWSWISHDPWGWAPYHYGRWFYSSPYGWCWYPGISHRRHYWSPALVGFVGFGRGVGIGVGFGFGHVGWVPLAPYDRFNRWWGSRYYGGYRSRNYVDNSVNIVNNVNITNIYRNARINNAVTAVDQDGFSRGRGGRSIRINEGEFSRGSVVEGQLPVVPHRDSLRVADRNVTGVNESRADRFYTRRTAAPVDRVPFEDQRRGMETIARRSFAGSTPTAGSTATEDPARGSRTEASESRGWRRLDQPTRSAPTIERSGERSMERSGERGPERVDRGEGEWRRFGTPRTTETSGVDAGPRGERPVRFGEPATARSPDATPASPEASRAVTRTSEDNGWRRFSDRSGDATTTTGNERRSERGGEGWRRESSPRGDVPRSESPRYESPRYESPRSESLRSYPRSERRSESGAGDSVRISPPIVRDRGDRTSFNEGARSAPRMESGSMRGADRGGDRGGDRGAARSGGSAPSGGDGGGRGASRGGEGRSGRSGR